MNIRAEVEAAEFGDKRLTARPVTVAEQLARAPDQSFPKAARSDAALEATYRFLGNESVTPAAILQPHVTATAARCAQAEAVFIAHDNTELRFGTERDGVGRISGDHSRGFIGHFALGGHIRNSGEPGWQVLGRGYEDLLLLERGAALALRCDQS